jgi:phage FluMu protein Com
MSSLIIYRCPKCNLKLLELEGIFKGWLEVYCKRCQKLRKFES